MLEHTAIGRGRRRLRLRRTQIYVFLAPRSGGFPASAPSSRVFQHMVLTASTRNTTIQQDKTQAAENNSPPPVSASRLKADTLEVAYTMGVQDWITAYQTGISRLRPISLGRSSGFLIAVACSLVVALVSYGGYVHAWHSQHSFPWHYVHIMLISSAVGPIAFAFVLWSMSSRRLVLEDVCIIVQFKYGGIVRSQYSGKLSFLWQRVSNISQEAEHLTICSENYIALVVPRRAFPNEQAAEGFYTAALAYWHEAKGTMPPPVPEIAGVWPPAPRPGNSAEPGDTR